MQHESLDEVGRIADEDIDLYKTALILSAQRHKGRSQDRYIQYFKKVKDQVADAYATLLLEGEGENAQTRLGALTHILYSQEGFTGDTEHYDDLDNADLMQVIDRRKGMPIALAILYIAAGRAQGWDVAGLNMPGHFICRIEHGGERLIFDPFAGGNVLNAADLRHILKRTHGPNAELSASYYEVAGNRETLIRLQNNIKLRLIEQEEYEDAVRIIETMRRIDPEEYRLLFDAGVLYARLDQNMAAMRALEGYIDRAPLSRDRQEAAILLQQIRQNMN